LPHQFSPAKNRIVAVRVVTTAVIFSEETGETGIPAATARITRQSESDGGTATEVKQETQHSRVYRHISEI